MTIDVRQHITDLRTAVDRLTIVIDGDPGRDVKGLRPRVDAIEVLAGEIRQERRDQRAYLRGFAAGLVLANVTGGGALVLQVLKLTGAIP